MDQNKIEHLLIQNIAKAIALEHVLMAITTVLDSEQRKALIPLIRHAAETSAEKTDMLGTAAPAVQASYDETYATFFRMLEE